MTGSKRSKLPQAALGTTRVDWSQWDPWAGAQGLLAVAIPLALGFVLGQPLSGAVAAGGALYIGLGSFDKRTRASTSALLVGSTLMGLAAMAGSLCGNQVPAITLLACLWALGAGLLSELGPPLSFIGLKTLVTLLIAGGYPSNHLEDALARALLVFSGALLQTLLFYLEDSFLLQFGAPHRQPNHLPDRNKSWYTLKNQFHFGSSAFHHALRLALGIGIAEAFCRVLLPFNSYWLPLTTAIVMRPAFDQTLARGFSRMAGTVIGVVLTTLIVIWFKPTGLTLGLLTLPSAWLCFSLFRASYTLYSVSITAYIVFMISFDGTPEFSALTNRLIGTLAGGALALLVYALWPEEKTPK